MRSSSLSSLRGAAVGVAVLSLAQIAVAFAPAAYATPLTILVGLAGAVLALMVVAGISGVEKLINRGVEICRKGARGDFQDRVTEVYTEGPVRDLLLGVNDVLDISDAFVREAGAAMDSAAEGKYYRKVLTVGLSGAYAQAASTINRGFEMMEAKDREIAEAAERDRLHAQREREETEKQLAEARVSARIKVALDSASTGVMVADDKFDIVYFNRAAEELFRRYERDFQSEFPGFRVEDLVGGSIDRFHKNPAHQRGMLSGLNTTTSFNAEIGDCTLTLKVSPVMDSVGNRLGATVEWSDVTEQVKIESEVSDLIAAAVRGDFSERLSTDGKHGFMLNLSEGVNKLMDTSSAGLEELADVLSSMARGDLSKRMEREYEGLFAELQRDSGEMADKLTEIVTQIRDSSDVVAEASAEIAEGTDDLSTRTESQAASLQQAAAAMEELSTTVRQNSDSADLATQWSAACSDVADRGSDVVGDVGRAMSTIENSSGKISEIISVIDEIAFQTNLLALNAAVEAARAGDAGKGFAVVANEVRSLAQRSADAAKDIKSLITTSNQDVKGGVKLVSDAQEIFTEIAGSVKRVTEKMDEIAHATKEQATGLQEVNEVVNRMDQNTQQNASLVEESAAAARSMADKADGLRDLISFFKVEGAKMPAGYAPNRSLAGPVPRQQVAAPQRARALPKTTPARRPVSNALPASDDWEEF